MSDNDYYDKTIKPGRPAGNPPVEIAGEQTHNEAAERLRPCSLCGCDIDHRKAFAAERRAADQEWQKRIETLRAIRAALKRRVPNRGQVPTVQSGAIGHVYYDTVFRKDVDRILDEEAAR